MVFISTLALSPLFKPYSSQTECVIPFFRGFVFVFISHVAALLMVVSPQAVLTFFGHPSFVFASFQRW
jgi:hypothetical protein